MQAFQDQPAQEIRLIAAKMEKNRKKVKHEKLFDPTHVRTSVTTRLAYFAYLNDPPATDVSTIYPSHYVRPNYSTG